MSDNPFDEDSDRTVIRPVPGGIRPTRTPPPDLSATRAPPSAAPRSAADATLAGRPATAAVDAGPIVLGLNPLVSAAGPLLALIARLSRTFSQPDPADLRERTLRQIRDFEREARTHDLPHDLVIKARYVLCAALDDVAQNTEWGSNGEWASRPLLVGFREGLRGYEGIQSGVGFFRLLDDAKRNPGAELPLLELIYLCLSLGFLGKLRVSQRPLAALDRVRQDLYTVISNHRKPAEAALSPHWQGVGVPYVPPRRAVPVWVIGTAALAAIGSLFVWFTTDLNAASNTVFERMLSAPVAQQPQIVRAKPVLPPARVVVSQPQPPETLATLLKPEIDRGLVKILGDHAMPVIRITNRGMFASGSATVAGAYVPLLRRIGQALNMEQGPVQVDGYTDNQPIHTVRFPSNFQLSAARAEAAAAIIGREFKQPDRLTERGHADADPIASNDTPEGRAENRRIEIVLHRQD
jgi:type VI secretion system protein ImpK